MSKSRKYLIAGNWKMNIPSSDAKELVDDIVCKVSKMTKVGILICPPFTSIQAAKDALAETTGILIGAQNFYPEKNGAYTGEVSAVMLRELGVSHVIIGHSERRTYFNEDDRFVNKKVQCALANSLVPVLCVGETISQRRENKELDVIGSQLIGALKGVSQADAKKVIVAYEPVWAIGTGETATPEIAQGMHSFIRGTLADMFGIKIAEMVKILYGGSMKADNAEEILKENDIDGGLIGGASLQAGSFSSIVKIADELSD
jgi:triosephosphate isomerase